MADLEVGQKQKEDEHLKHCWKQVPVIEDEVQQLGQQLLTSHFLFCQGLLYHHTMWWGQPTDLLVVSCSKIDVVMHLANYHPLGHHLAAGNTTE